MGEGKLLLYYLGQIPIKIWHIVSGVFFLGWRLKFEKRRQEREDTHHFFKVENRRRTTVLTLKAQRDIKAYVGKKKMYPKKASQNANSSPFHNYFATVVAPIDFKMTLDKALASYYYDAIGPYFEALYYLRVECLRALNNPHEMPAEKKRYLRDRLAAFPPLEKIARESLLKQKAIAEQIRKEQDELNAKREKAQYEQDRAYFETEIKLQKQRLEDAEKKLKDAQRLKRDLGVG